MPKPASDRLLIGLDPGLAVTGYGVIAIDGLKARLVEGGVIRIVRTHALENRLKELHDGITEILQQYAVESVAIEQLYSHYERPRTAILMAHARGVLCLAAAQRNLAIYSYKPTAVKKTLTGNGHANKLQMQLAVQHQLGLKKPPEPPDVADALAVAICHHGQLLGSKALQ
jgi:crossover junction endodeoxyribonuclease RuvC